MHRVAGAVVVLALVLGATAVSAGDARSPADVRDALGEAMLRHVEHRATMQDVDRLRAMGRELMKDRHWAAAGECFLFAGTIHKDLTGQIDSTLMVYTDLAKSWAEITTPERVAGALKKFDADAELRAGVREYIGRMLGLQPGTPRQAFFLFHVAKAVEFAGHAGALEPGAVAGLRGLCSYAYDRYTELPETAVTSGFTAAQKVQWCHA